MNLFPYIPHLLSDFCSTVREIRTSFLYSQIRPLTLLQLFSTENFKYNKLINFIAFS